MKIGLIGGMVNNLYAMSKVLARVGYDIKFVRDVEDTFVSHQPIWLDQRFFITYGELSIIHTLDDCLDFERKRNWSAPNWYVNPIEQLADESLPRVPPISDKIKHFFYKRRLARNPTRGKILDALRDVDFVIACGLLATNLARLSGKPYLIWVYGGDIRKLLRLEPRPQNLVDCLYDEITINLYKDSYRNAKALGFNYGTRIYCCGGYKPTPKTINFKTPKVIIPFPALYYGQHELEPLPEAIAVSQRDVYHVLVPSRIDYSVKGHEKLLRAIARLPNDSPISFIFTGWGQDKNLMETQIRELGIADLVNVLDCMLSRPMLYDLIQSVDLVIDQFNMGIYGSAALEAMGLGKPVMMYIDAALSSLPVLPPVLNCRTEDDIRNCLINILKGKINLQGRGQDCKEWTNDYHGDEAFIKSIERVLD